MPPVPPLLPVALALAAGIVVAGVCASPWWVLVPVGVSMAAFALRHTHLALVAAVYATGMILALSQQRPLPTQAINGEISRYSGVVTELRDLDSTMELIVAIDSIDGSECVPLRSLIRVPGFDMEISERDRLGFSGSLRPLESRAVIPDEIDRNSRLKRQGVMAEGFVRPAEIISCHHEPGVLNDLRRSRTEIQRLIVSLPINDATQYFLIASLTGDRQYLHPDTTQMYASGGIAHILALSGLHVAIIMGCIMLVLMPLRFWKFHALARLVAIVSLWGFAVLTGLAPSVVRAVIMATVWLASRQLQRRPSPLNSLAFAAIVLMVAEPRVIYTVGFQLSFAAVAGIILLAKPLNPVKTPRSSFYGLGAAVAISVAAILATGIVSAYYFNIFPVYFLPVNLPVALLLPPLLGGGLVLIAFKAVGIDLPWLCSIVDSLHSAIDTIAKTVGGLPGATLQNVWIEPREIAIYYLVLLSGVTGLYYKRRLLTAASLTLALIAVAGHFLLRPSFPVSELYLTSTSTETSMLLREGEEMRLYSTLKDSRLGELLGRDSVIYSRYMLRRGVRTFTRLSAEESIFPARRSEDYIIAHDRAFQFVNGPEVRSGVYSRSPDYLVVCRGFRGDIVSLARKISPDTVILGGDLNRRRHDRYLRELITESIPVRSLRDSCFILTRDL